MVDALGIIVDELPPTLTYSKRRFAWMPEREDCPNADGRLGTLSIFLIQGERWWKNKVETSHYRVEWFDFSRPWRGIVLLKLNDNPDGLLYHVRNEPDAKCECIADNCKAPCCRHKDVYTRLVELGALPGVPENVRAA